MILIDANLLVYAHVASFPQHADARTWLDGRINAAAPVGLPWPSLLAFVRIVSNPRIFDRPASISAAWRQVESWPRNRSGFRSQRSATNRFSPRSWRARRAARISSPTPTWPRSPWLNPLRGGDSAAVR